jgi:hypothetical protein
MNFDWVSVELAGLRRDLDQFEKECKAIPPACVSDTKVVNTSMILWRLRRDLADAMRRLTGKRHMSWREFLDE